MNYKDFAENLKKTILDTKEFEIYSKCNRLLLDERNLHAQHNIKLKSMLQET